MRSWYCVILVSCCSFPQVRPDSCLPLINNYLFLDSSQKSGSFTFLSSRIYNSVCDLNQLCDVLSLTAPLAASTAGFTAVHSQQRKGSTPPPWAGYRARTPSSLAVLGELPYFTFAIRTSTDSPKWHWPRNGHPLCQRRRQRDARRHLRPSPREGKGKGPPARSLSKGRDAGMPLPHI